jgi:FkbM family methyltransferase
MRLLLPGDTFIDGGAHHGYFTLLAASLVGTGGLVIALEPHPGSRTVLTENARLNGMTQVKVLPYAVGERSGRQDFYLGEFGNAASSSLYRLPGNKDARIEVDIRSIDDTVEQFGRPSVRLVKLDVEGAELAAVRGMERTRNSSPELFVILEFRKSAILASGTDENGFLDALMAMGYRIEMIRESLGVVPLDRAWLTHHDSEVYGPVNLLLSPVSRI